MNLINLSNIKKLLQFPAVKTWLLKKLADKNAPPEILQKKIKEDRRAVLERAKHSFRLLKFLFRERRRKYLQSTPWYLVLGEVSSGKSTLIERSELDFSHEAEIKIVNIKEHLSEVNGHRWWFSKNGVLVETTLLDQQKIEASHPQNEPNPHPSSPITAPTADSYNTASYAHDTPSPSADQQNAQQQIEQQKINSVKARGDWRGFLHLLKKYRRHLPINGIVVTIDLIDFLAKDTLQIQNYTRSIKFQIMGLVQYFKVKLKVPVYLVFTKCDLLAGFTDFFDDLTLEERKQILGITLPLNHPSDNKSVAAFLAQEFDKLIARLNERILPRLAAESSFRRRELIVCFPQQLQLCKTVLNKFIAQTFTTDVDADVMTDAPNSSNYANSTHLQFRGFYFTSGQQHNRPQDVLMSVIADKLSLEKPQLAEQLFNAQSYFTGSLFKNLILPEMEFVGDVPRLKIRKHRIAYVLMPVMVVLGAIGLWSSYYSNLLGIEQASDQLSYYKQLASKVPSLQTLQKGELGLTQRSSSNPIQTSRLDEVLPPLNVLQEVMPVYQNIPQNWLLPAGLATPWLVEDAVHQALHSQLQKMLLPRVKAYLEELIRLDITHNKPYDLYNDLKGYLALNLTSKIAPFWIEPPLFSGLDKDPTLNQTQKQALKKFIAMVVKDGFRKQELNTRLVAAARDKLRQISLAKRAYWYIKEKDLFGQQKGIDINDEIGSALEEIFANSDQTPIIPAFFSKAGFEYLYRKSDRAAVDEIASSDLVMGVNNVRLSKIEKEHMSEELRDLYADEYYQQWQEALNTLSVVNFQNLDHALRVLRILTSSASPVPKLLSLTNLHTEPLVHANLGAVQFFKTLDRVTQQQGTEYVQLIEINKTLTKLHDFLAKIDNEPDPRAIYKTAVDLMNGTLKGDPITQLYNQAQALPAPLNQWYISIAQNSLKVILQVTRQIINDDWKANVIGEYQDNLAGRYPFDINASTEASIDNFSHFFAPQATFDTFYQKDLQSFIDNRNWQLKTKFGQNIGIPNEKLAQIIKMVNIRDKYFADGSKQPHLKFVLKPITLTEQAARMELRMGSQTMSYAHGPQRGYTWLWPAPGDAQESSFVFTLFGGSTPGNTYQGNWAWFKLLADAKIYSNAPDAYYFTVKAADGSYASFQITLSAGSGVLNSDWWETLALPEQL